MLALIIIGIIIGCVLFYIFDPYHLFVSKRPTNIYDCGYESKPRGWYDFRKQGVNNDFCRYSGDSANPTFSCQLGDNPVTDNVTYPYDANAPYVPFDKNQFTCKWP
jgi:hypothetical protein